MLRIVDIALVISFIFLMILWGMNDDGRWKDRAACQACVESWGNTSAGELACCYGLLETNLKNDTSLFTTDANESCLRIECDWGN